MASASTQESIDAIKGDNQELSALVGAQDNASLADLLTNPSGDPKQPPAGSSAPAAYQPAQLTHPKQEEAAAKAYKAKEAAAQQQRATTKKDEAEIAAVNASPWTQLGNALASQFQQAETPVAAAVSGSGIGTAQEGAASQALSSLGLSPGSSAGSWLAGQTAAAQQTAAPVEQAMAQEGAQYSAEAGPISKALQAYGQANALQVSTAPEASWLNALASHVTSNLSYEGVIPTAALPSLDPSVAKALQESGGYIGTSGAGTTPVQNVESNAQGGSKAIANAAASLSAGAGAGTGVVPAPSAAPGG